MESEEFEAIRARIRELQVEHRDLDAVIARLSETPYPDQLQLRRLKNHRWYMTSSMDCV